MHSSKCTKNENGCLTFFNSSTPFFSAFQESSPSLYSKFSRCETVSVFRIKCLQDCSADYPLSNITIEISLRSGKGFMFTNKRTCHRQYHRNTEKTIDTSSLCLRQHFCAQSLAKLSVTTLSDLLITETLNDNLPVHLISDFPLEVVSWP